MSRSLATVVSVAAGVAILTAVLVVIRRFGMAMADGARSLAGSVRREYDHPRFEVLAQ